MPFVVQLHSIRTPLIARCPTILSCHNAGIQTNPHRMHPVINSWRSVVHDRSLIDLPRSNVFVVLRFSPFPPSLLYALSDISFLYGWNNLGASLVGAVTIAPYEVLPSNVSRLCILPDRPAMLIPLDNLLGCALLDVGLFSCVGWCCCCCCCWQVWWWCCWWGCVATQSQSLEASDWAGLSSGRIVGR